MTPLDVITLAEAKKELVVDADYTDRDTEITRLIKTAISWVEQYTCYRLWQRTEVFNAIGCHTDLPYYPITIDSVKDSDDEDVTYTQKNGALSIVVSCPAQSVINATVGFSDVTDIPQPLVSASYKLITYLFENKDTYSVDLPIDIQLMLNQYRRSATI